MLLAHSYAGWLIFLGWIVIFWGVPHRNEPKPERGNHVEGGISPTIYLSYLL